MVVLRPVALRTDMGTEDLALVEVLSADLLSLLVNGGEVSACRIEDMAAVGIEAGVVEGAGDAQTKNI